MRQVFLIAVLAVGVVPGVAVAAPGAGTLEDPVVVDAFPYVAAGSTIDADSSAISGYGCAPELDESGPEVVYRFEVTEAAKVTAWIEGDDGVVDVDIQLLGSDALEGGVATDCLGRGNAISEADVQPGTYYAVVDTYAGAEQAGDFVLHLHAIGESWFQMPVGRGVTWRARRTSRLGGPQVLHAIEVDLSEPGVSLEVALPTTCATVADTVGDDTSVVAAVNSSFFGGCQAPVSLMKNGGELLATNGASVARGALGLTEAGEPMLDRIGPGADWPEAFTAQGGIPTLIDEGMTLQGEEAWAIEGISSASFIGPNPRTVAGYREDGSIVLGTVDGRRPSAVGMSLDLLAQWGADELEAFELVNLDGGGSTTMWVRGATPSGVANYPSDGGMTESPDHAGSRAVVGAVLVHAQDYNWAPRFQTEPVTQTAVGESYAYDVDAIDLDPEDTITYGLSTAPPGMSIDPVTGEIAFSPELTSPPMADVTVTADDGHGGVSEQSFVLEIEGAQGPGSTTGGGETGVSSASDAGGDSDPSGDPGSSSSDPGSTSTGSGTEASLPEDDDSSGCGCTTGSREGPGFLVGTALLLGFRRRCRFS